MTRAHRLAVRKANRFFILMILLVLRTGTGSAQVATGTPPFGSFGGGPDVINVANLNSHFSVPVLHKAGRGMDFTYDLGYDTAIWYPTSPGSGSWQPVLNWGWSGQTEMATGYVSRFFTILQTCRGHNGNIIGQRYMWSNWIYYDPWGTPHYMGGPSIFVSGTCGTPVNFSDVTDGYTLTTTNGAAFTLYDRFGKQLFVPINNITGGGSAIDRNGNEITADSSGHFTDTLGTIAVTVSGSAPNPLTFTYNAPGPQGTGVPVAVTVSYKTYTVKTNFACSGIAEYGPTSNSLVDAVTLPDGTFYQFAYEPTPGFSGDYTGRVASVTLPTGGTISYQYSGGGTGVNGITCKDGGAATVTRTTPDGVWTYARVLGTGSASTTTVTDPQSNNTVVQFQSGIYETQRQVYQGAISPSNLLQTTTTCYNGNTSNCMSTSFSLPITQRNVTVTLPGGSQSEHDDFWNAYSAATETDDYDFGAAPHGPLLRKIVAAYANLGNVHGMRQTVSVQDVLRNTRSNTVYNYDETSVVSTSGTPQQVAVSGPRGNVTSVNTYVSGTTFLTKTNTYFDTGNVQTATDVNGAQTTYTYGACGNSFATSVSEPLSLSRSLSWNCTGGVQTSRTDENNQTTTTTYSDPYFWRPASIMDPTNAVTSFCYGLVTGGSCALNPNQTESILTFNSNNSTADTLSTVDGLGRVHVQQTRQGPASTNFDSVETDYDALGRVSRLTLPYVGTAGQTNSTVAATTTTYDAMNRSLSVSDGGGGSTAYSYGQGNDVLVTRSPAPQNESTKRRQFEYDALHRLTSVCEVTAGTTAWPGGNCAQTTTQTGYWTKYAYDPMGNLMTVTQDAQAAASLQQNRAYVYDWMGRMVSETAPEIGPTPNGNGTATYTYDSDATCGTSNGDLVKRVDAAGNTICSTYDSLHRQLTTTYPSGTYAAVTPQKHFVYDGATVNGQTLTYAKARLAEAYTCSSSCTTKATDIGLSYTARGEISDVYESTPNSSGFYYHTSQSYWANGSLNQSGSNIASLPTITYGPDGEGRTTTVSASSGQNPVSGTTYNAASLPTAINLGSGSGDSDAFNYDSNTNRMAQYQLTVNGTSLTGALGWNANGTLQTQNITDGFNSANTQNCSYGYDDITRVTSANCGSAASQTFAYDPFGNISKSGSPYSFQPTYSTSTNRMTSIVNFTPIYDNNGNVTNDSFHNYAWDADGHPISVDAGQSDAVSLVYDALGRMVEQNRSGTYTQIAYSPAGQKLALMNGQTLQKATLRLSGKSFAVYNSSGLLYYGHPNLLGSIPLGTTSGRAMYFDVAYAPFGETYAQAGTVDPAYTGQMSDTAHRQDTAGGLYDFPLREYSTQGRWPSPDPAGMSSTCPKDPQSQNRYAYVRNNPLSYVDPLGAQGCNPEDPTCGGGGGADCDPNDPFCGVGPGTGGGGGGRGEGWPGTIWFPVPLFPPGLFSSLGGGGVGGGILCECYLLVLTPCFDGCLYECTCSGGYETLVYGAPHTALRNIFHLCQLNTVWNCSYPGFNCTLLYPHSICQ